MSLRRAGMAGAVVAFCALALTTLSRPVPPPVADRVTAPAVPTPPAVLPAPVEYAPATLTSDPFALAIERARCRAAGLPPAVPGIAIRETRRSSPPFVVRKIESVEPGGRVLGTSEMIAGESLFVLDESLPEPASRAWLKARSLTPIRRSAVRNIWRVRCPEGLEPEDLVARFAGEPGLEEVFANVLVRAAATTPNDTY